MSEEDDVLDPLITAPIEVPAKMLGLVLSIAKLLSSADGEKFHNDLTSYVREWKKQDVIHIKAPPAEPEIPETMDEIAIPEVVIVPPVSVKPPEGVSLTIRVDRAVPPAYPRWAQKVIDKELEFTGFDTYDTGKLELWTHPTQTGNNGVKGKVIYEHLKAAGLLVSCLGLRDLEEIQRIGLAHFRLRWRAMAVCSWKSVVEDENNRLYAPSIFEHEGRVVIDWRWLGLSWRGSRPALRFPD